MNVITANDIDIRDLGHLYNASAKISTIYVVKRYVVKRVFKQECIQH